MRTFALIWNTNQPFICHSCDCKNKATWCMDYLGSTYLLCDEHKAAEQYLAVTNNMPYEIITDCSVMVDFTPEEKES